MRDIEDTACERLVIPNNDMLWLEDCVPETLAVDDRLWSVTIYIGITK